MNERIQISRDDIQSLPQEAGCYLFKEVSEATGKEKILYVGKAKNLRNRVRQYFVAAHDQRAFVKFIREKTNSIEFMIARDETEALVLENELIKKHRPPYNIHLRDDKRYLSLRFDLQHEWPRIELVRKIKKDGAIYLGPFLSSQKLRETIDIMQKIFQLRSCPDSKLYNRSRPCIEYDIKRCVAPCVGYVSREDYRELCKDALLFLKGQNKDLLDKLRAAMESFVQAENYEEAAAARDRIAAIKGITNQELSVVRPSDLQRGKDLDVIALAGSESGLVICILYFRDGILRDQRLFEVDRHDLDDLEILDQFLSRYYTDEVYIPHEILIPLDLDSSFNKERLPLVEPRLADKKELVQLAQKNAEARLQAKSAKAEKLAEVLSLLQSKLALSKWPERMDCLDISHHQGSEVVASVVRFNRAVPDKENYRKILLKHQIVDDFACMKEAIERRYHSAEDLPDLIVIDGGKGQLSSAKEILKEMDFLDKVDLISLAKARSEDGEVDPHNPKNRERIFKPGRKNPILLKESSREELLLSFMRDEAHRFAITYHRLRKTRALSISILDEIDGISSRVKLKLLKNFGSLEGIVQATDMELLKFLKGPALDRLREKLASLISVDTD